MDLDGLFKRAFDGFGSDPERSKFPGFPGGEGSTGNEQTIDVAIISRLSRFSRSENESLGSDQNFEPEKTDDFCREDRALEAPFKTPGNPGNPGKASKDLAKSETYDFPVSSSFPGKIEGNREIGGLPAGFDPLPITPAEVRAGVAREMRELADLGVTGPEAERRAVEITWAKVGNSAALAQRQMNTGRCAVCDAPLRDEEAAIAVLNPGGSALHIHAGCHEAHRADRRALVDRIMAAAGYGAKTEREAA